MSSACATRGEPEEWEDEEEDEEEEDSQERVFNGIVLDIGHEVTYIVPIYQGYSLPHAILRLDLGVQQLGAERSQLPEALFKPNLLGLEQDGIHKLVFDSIMKCDNDIRRDLYSYIVLTGGGSMYAGLADRLLKEISALCPASIKPQVIEPADRQNGVWRGGDKLAPLLSEYGSFITAQEYEKYGPTIVHRKCY